MGVTDLVHLNFFPVFDSHIIKSEEELTIEQCSFTQFNKKIQLCITYKLLMLQCISMSRHLLIESHQKCIATSLVSYFDKSNNKTSNFHTHNIANNLQIPVRTTKQTK